MNSAALDIVVVNTGVANVRAIPNMLRRLGSNAEIAGTPERLAESNCLILPGIGSYDAAIKQLHARNLWEILKEKANAGTPLLGICLGMQLMAEGSDEGEEPGFGWFHGRFKRFHCEDGGETRLRIPHMGWNLIKEFETQPLYAGLQDEARFYFSHSYYIAPIDKKEWCGVSDYGVRFASGIARDNFYGVQFHPEKSHRFGLKLFENFLELARKQ